MSPKLIYASICIAIVACCLVIWGGVEQRRAIQAEGQSKLLAQQLSAKESQIAQTNTQIAALSSQVQAAEELRKQAEARLADHPAPPKAPPTPQTAPELSAALESAGWLKGVEVLPALPKSSLALPDAQIAVSDHLQAIRVPALEGRLDAMTGVTEAQAEELRRRAQQSVLEDQGRQQLTDAIGLSKQQTSVEHKAYLTERHSKVKVAIEWGAAGLVAGLALRHH